MPPALSIVVCTRNRAALLDSCLAGLSTEQGDPGEIELLVVDNGSTDTTPDVIARWAVRNEALRSVVEPEPGLSRARNVGVGAARGAIVAFVDDDAIVRPGWAAALIEAFDRDHEVVVVAGRVLLRFGSDPPAWFSPRFTSWYSGLDLGDEPATVAPGQWVVGANLALRRDAVEEVGGFRHDLGRRAGNLIGNEEIELIDRLRDAGTIRYEPRAAVDHLVPAERLRLRWLARRAFDQGRADVRAGHAGDAGTALAALRACVSGVRPALRRLRAGPVVEEATVELVSRARRAGAFAEHATADLRRGARPRRGT